jgi:RNA polymerase sigma factor (sigma-70 family)
MNDKLANILFGSRPRPGFSNAAKAALGKLGEMERLAILMRLEGKTYEEIANVIGCNVSKARQLEAKAIRRLRFYLREY